MAEDPTRVFFRLMREGLENILAQPDCVVLALNMTVEDKQAVLRDITRAHRVLERVERMIREFGVLI